VYLTGTAGAGKSVTAATIKRLLGPVATVYSEDDTTALRGVDQALSLIERTKAESRKGRVVVADLVDSLGAFRVAMVPSREGGDSPASLVCLYCNALETVDRWKARGSHNKHSGTQGLAIILSQWASYYRLTPIKSASAVDVMHSQDFEALKSLVAADEPLGRFLLGQMAHTFPFTPSTPSLYVEPRLPYDWVVNTSGKSPDAVAQQVKQVLDAWTRNPNAHHRVLYAPVVSPQVVLHAQDWENHCRAMPSTAVQHAIAQCAENRQKVLDALERDVLFGYRHGLHT
jgi:hypothetical protein